MDFLFLFFVSSLICGGLQFYIHLKKKNITNESENNNNNNSINNKKNNNKNGTLLDIGRSEDVNNKSEIDKSNFFTENEEKQFKKFQNKYLLTYLLAMASDWLQGPYVYALYESYGYSKQEIAILFIFGFLSSLVFGMAVGPIIDKYGRKKMGIIFGIFYGFSCLTKVINSFSILLIGRLLGGIATSLLFSVFESWMIAEHNSRGFKEELLASTFYKSSLLNGLIAILSGLFASEVANRWGYVSPFLWAFSLLVVCSIIIATQWNENYGDSSSSLIETLKTSIQTSYNSPGIISIGIVQSFFEASMYTFVFMWTPTLSESPDLIGVQLPFGLIFATFMVCVMIGSSIFNLLSHIKPELLIQYILLFSSICFVIPFYFKNSLLIYMSFLSFEVLCGCYFPCIGTLRSKYIPESIRATVMNLYRVPLNILVVTILLNIERLSNQRTFLSCAIWLIISLAYYRIFISRSQELIKVNK
ncbi:hypothetical protein RB653_001362 [Dictyostelium firmibasis]|uniref:Molybdate-anion transporter n=1 Tax=Dictyostelium firmibasis TaxID=79012 RepID=A0AAN7YWK1_9MYCE